MASKREPGSWGEFSDAVGAAQRSVRFPAAALATALGSLLHQLPACLGAVYEAHPDGVGVDLLAAGGAEALRLGRLGSVEMGTAAAIHGLVDDLGLASGGHVDPARLPEPWTAAADATVITAALPVGGVMVVVVGCTEPVSAAPVEAAAPELVPLVALASLHRQVDRLSGELRALRQERVALGATLRHDVGVPLGAIRGAAEALLSTRAPGEPERQELLRLVIRQTDRLSSMVNDAVARDLAGPDSPLRLATVPIHELVQRAVDAASANRAVKVEINVPDGSITTDPERIERALVNLFDNARKYCPPDQPVRVLGERVDGGVELTVADAGPGVPQELVPALFTSYLRDAGRLDSTGLGLRSVASLASEVGGRVRYSRVAGWTRFTLYVPDWSGEVGR